MFQRGGCLDLGDDLRLRRDSIPEQGEIFGGPDKGERHPIDADLAPDGRVTAIFFGQRRQHQGGAGKDDALVPNHAAADQDLAREAGRRALDHFELDQTVVEIDEIPWRYGIKCRWLGDLKRAWLWQTAEHDLLAAAQPGRGRIDGADLGALQILHELQRPS